MWLATDKGAIQLVIKNEHPVFFVEQYDLKNITALLQSFKNQYYIKHLPLKTFSLRAVVGIYFYQNKVFYQARSKLTDNNIAYYEGGFRLHERYLMERFVLGSLAFVGDETSKKNYSSITDVKVKPCNYRATLTLLSLDIECSEKGVLYSIGFYANKNQKVFKRVIMIRSAFKQTAQKSLDYLQWVADERELLVELVKTIQEIDPDIIIGWNVINFDFRLLHLRAKKNKMTLNIGRDNSAFYWRDNLNEKNQGYVSIAGRVVIDGIAAMKAEAYSFASFSLEAIAQHFLGRGKSTEDVAFRMETINRNFKYSQVELAEYNLQDCILVWDIFEKIKLMDYLIFRSQLTGLELDRAGGSVAAFTNLYLPKLHRHGYISPNLPKDGGLASPGGYVMNSLPGLYKNVLVLDFKSLYPAIIRTFKIDPMGLIEGEINPENAIEGFRGGAFSRDKHLLPEIITELWAKRDIAKREKDHARSQAIKIIMNSFYGVLGSGGCAFYDTKLASSITLRGHEIMQQTAKWIEQKGLKVIYGDTDSTFVLLDDHLTPLECNDIGQSLVEYINSEWQLKLRQEFDLDCFLEIEFESHFKRFLMPTIRGSEKGSKKRYAGVINKKGHDTIIFKGLENVRSDWTDLAKTFQQTLYEMIFNDQDPTAFILKTVQQTLSGERDSELIYRKRLRRSLDRYIKNVPPHVKAARLADYENDKRNLPLRYQNKGWISYLMTQNGPQPMEYVVSAIDYQFYIERQIEPVADGILPFIGLSFKQIVDKQLGLF